MPGLVLYIGMSASLSFNKRVVKFGDPPTNMSAPPPVVNDMSLYIALYTCIDYQCF